MAALTKASVASGSAAAKHRDFEDKTPHSHKGPLEAIRSLPASKAKTHFLELLKDVDTRHQSILITRRGRPVAQLVPVPQEQPRSIFGYMKGTIKITGDIVGPEPDIWEAMS